MGRTMFNAGAVAAFVSLGLLAACGSTGAGTGDGEGAKARVAMIQIGNYEYAQVAFKGAKEAAKLDGDAKVTFVDGGFDPQAQLQRCKDVVASGKYDAIVLMPVSATGILPCVNQARAQDIPIVALSTPIGPDADSIKLQTKGIVSQVLVTPTDDAVATVEMTKQACADVKPCKVVVGIGDPALAYPAAKLAATKKLFATEPDVKVVGSPAIGYADAAKGYASGRDILTTYPDVNVIISDTDATLRGVERAVKEAGKLGTVKLIGDGGSQYAWDAINDGRWFGSGYYTPAKEGQKATDLAIAAARGEKVEPYVASATLNARKTLILTKESLKELKSEYKGS